MTEIHIQLTLRSPLNIGSGAQRGTLARRAMLKDAEGWPFIPASAFKGKLRHAVEQVAEAMQWKPAGCVVNREACRQCVVCRLFGAPWQPGRLRFSRLALDGPPEVMALKKKIGLYPRTTQRMGVAINRRRQVAEEDLLYSTELLWPGLPLEFAGSISGPLNRQQAGLLLAGLQLLPALGRGKTGGLGWIKVEAEVAVEDELWDQAELLALLEREGDHER